MPELPEVETSRRGIEPHVLGKRFKQVVVRQQRLRWAIDGDLPNILAGVRLSSLDRRGKYLLFNTQSGTLIVHLGMSGSLRITDLQHPPRKHDHVDFVFDGDTVLRFHDPRKFGAILWTTAPIQVHPLMASLGPEPLLDLFDAPYLWQVAQKRRIPIKSLIMDSHVVVGVGNIYANESLFMAGLQPARRACDIDLEDCQRLVTAIKQVLQRSIDQGGTTLRDFVNPQGNPGYFKQTLTVYGRTGEPCLHCGEPIQSLTIAQRSSFYCAACQH